MPQLETDLGPSPATSLTEADQRNHSRHLCIDGGVLRFAVRPAYRGQRSVLLDVSAGGLGLLLGAPLEVGSVLALDLCLPQGAGASGLVAYVRHCTAHPAPEDAPWLPRRPILPRLLRRLVGLPAPLPAKAWLAGCEFSRPLADDELAELLRLLGLCNAGGRR